jgi:DNA polymerase III delta prime subunit|tara:strand:- start:305 stop:1267 length:963 start_codon:yes stop_codon:yes gene_type:complete
MNFLRLYKPKKIDDFNIEPIYKEIIDLYKKDNNLRFIINGNNSVGKTSLIKVILEEYYGKKFSKLKDNIIYINYIKDQGINYYRNELKQFCQINNFNKDIKNTIIIDDLDLINFNSQQIVKTYITNYKNINFIFSCNNINKIDTNILYLLENIYIKPNDIEFINKVIDKILENEKIFFENIETKHFLINLSNLLITNVLNNLNKIKIIYGDNVIITKQILEKDLLYIYTNDLNDYINYCKNKKYNAAINILLNIYNAGYSIIDILDEFNSFIKNNKALSEKHIFEILKLLCKYINIFSNVNDNILELYFLTVKIIDIFNT